MSNIDKQAVTAKTKELASLMVERFSMNPVSCKLLNEAWGKEFPDEVAIAERMLALLDELEYYKSREERVTKLVMDNSTSWDALYKKLEAAEKRIAEQSAIVAAAEKLVRCKGRYHSEL
ncbi:ead/Ea22-like family protein, partial [Salmonella enterica subsp. enterica serovar Schwarzengrund]